jgi:hypothetical protein
MVDCAHGNDGFQHLNKSERAALVIELIALIKKHTVEGFSIFARAESYRPFDNSPCVYPDVYSECAAGCVSMLHQFLQTQRQHGSISYFFEKGHKNKGSAYNHIARTIQRKQDSLVFADKTELCLLQAADLLAWQSTKYAKDYFYPKFVSGEPKREARKDFISLMEHRHTFMHLHLNRGDNSVGIEMWPLSMRAPTSVNMLIGDDGPIVYFRLEGDEMPVIPIEKPLGFFKTPGGNMVQVAFEGMKESKFALSFDEQRLNETIRSLINISQVYKSSEFTPALLVENFAAESIEGHAILRLKLFEGGTMAFVIPAKLVDQLKQELAKL